PGRHRTGVRSSRSRYGTRTCASTAPSTDRDRGGPVRDGGVAGRCLAWPPRRVVVSTSVPRGFPSCYSRVFEAPTPRPHASGARRERKGNHMWPFGKNAQGRVEDAIKDQELTAKLGLKVSVKDKVAFISGQVPNERYKNLLKAMAT